MGGGTAVLGGDTIVDFGMVTCFTVPRGDLYFGASHGSGLSALEPRSGTMMSYESPVDCAYAGPAGGAAARASNTTNKARVINYQIGTPEPGGYSSGASSIGS
jgi:hypothetical protein